MKPSKENFKNWLREYCTGKDKVRILDLGSGTSNNFVDLINDLPQIEYVGVEPWKVAYEIAKKSLDKNKNRVSLYNENAYDIKDLQNLKDEDKFDLVCSLSTLEHVKYLDKFLKFSANMTKKGGLNLHLWDNAHELMSISFKEKLQCFISNNFKFIIPSLKFVRVVYSKEVKDILEKKGLKFKDLQYFHLKSTMHLLKSIKNNYDLSDIYKINEYENFVKTKLINLNKQLSEKINLEKEFMTLMLIMQK